MSIMVIVDGMPDGGDFDFKSYKYMGKILETGGYGQFETCPLGFEADSMVCILTLLGREPQEIPIKSRTYFEALAKDIPLAKEDLVLRYNLAEYDPRTNILLSSCASSLDSGKMRAIGEALEKKITGESYGFYPFGGYKNLLVMRGRGKDIGQIKTYAPHQHVGEKVETLLPNSQELRNIIEESEEVLRSFSTEEKAYILLPWGESVPAVLTKLPNSAAICQTEIVRGMARAMGMKTPVIEGTTGDVDTDLAKKVRRAIDESKTKSFVLLHINGADEAAHRKNPAQKHDFIKRIDEEVIKRLMTETEEEILITSDHTTSPYTGRHEKDPQPFIIYRSEKYRGNMGRWKGSEALNLFQIKKS